MKRYTLILLLQGACFAQGVVTTVAGTDYIFPDDGKPALQAHLAGAKGMAFDRQGNLFFAEPYLNMVLKLDTKGVISVVAGNGLLRFTGEGGPARAASLAAPWGIAFDAAGNLYIADAGNGRVRKVDTAGVISTVAGGGALSPGDGNPATQVGLNEAVAVAFDPAGNLLIVERAGSRLRKVDSKGIITTIAGNGKLGFAGDGSLATAASFQAAEGLAVAPDGTIYVADANNGRVRKIATNGTITTFAGGGNDPSSSGIPATTASLNVPTAVVLDSQGNLYIAERFGNRVRRVSPNGTITNVAGTGAAGFTGDGGAANGAHLASPFGVAVDSGGNVFVSDLENARLRRIDSAGTITSVAGQGAFIGDGGPATAARFSTINDIAVDPQGNLYIADQVAQRVRKVTPGGQISTVAGVGVAGLSPDGTPAASAFVRDPSGVAIDPQGNLVFTEANNYLVRRIDNAGLLRTVAGTFANVGFNQHIAMDAAGNVYNAANTPAGFSVKKITPDGIVSTYAGTGNTGFSGDGGAAVSANLSTITGLAVDSAGNLYIADGDNARVRRVSPQGLITTFAGNGQLGNSGDGGPATSAAIAFPTGVAADAAGNIYVSGGNSRIRRVSPSGIITTWAGNGGGFSGDGGPALSAAFAGPASLAISPQGNLYVADRGNNRIRLIQAGPSPSIVASQKGLTFVASTGGGAPASQSFTIVNGGQGTLNWGVSASTLSGGNWLSVTPASGASAASNAGPLVQVSVNPSGLAAGDYYGQIQILASGAPNSPQSVTVVLTVRAPGAGTGCTVQPSGLLFTTTATQSFTLTTLSTSPVSFSGTASFGGPAWFTASPASGATVSGKPATVPIVPNLAGLAAGVYNGNITFAFSDNSAQSVQLLLVISASAGAAIQPNAPGVRLAACAPGKLLPLFTSLGSGFSLTTGWPSPVELRVVDDCGQPLTKGAVTASFSNTDPSLTLNSLGDGRWTGTWQAQNATANVSVSANAVSADQSLSGTSQVSGGLNKNANPPPLVAPGGVLNAASYQLQGGLAPGSLVSIFGSLLAQGAVSAPALPLTSTLGGTTVTIAGRKLPLLFAGPDQVNAMIPYDLAINASHQVVVQRGTALSNPEAISVLSSQSGVFTKDLTGTGTGIVVKVTADGTQSIVAADNPAHAFEALVIYCAGLGDVDPRQIAGQQATFSPLSQTLDAVKVTIGGVDAPVFFAGLTPGFTGLYQVNAFVPVGVAPGDNVQLVITQAGRTSPPVLISVR